MPVTEKGAVCMPSPDESARRATTTAGCEHEPSTVRHVALVAGREWTLLRRSRAAAAALALLFGVAWLPMLLASARAGSIGPASFVAVSPLALALGGVVLPLLGLLAGADVLAGEIEDRSLLPLLTASISRRACYAGKLLGTATALGAAYVAAFGSAALVIALARGSEGAGDYAVVAAAGFSLTLSALVLGAALAAGGGGRVRAYALALAAWMLLVIALDAVLLGAVVLSAPAPPVDVGGHGHDELSASAMQMPAGSDDQAAGAPADGGAYPWFLLLDPVDLYRLTVLRAGPGLRASWLAGAAPPGGGAEQVALAIGWLFWLVAPAVAGGRRFGRAVLV